MGQMEWTPDAIKAEIEYRQCALRADARRSRLVGKPTRTWWQRLANR
jgi:lambda repressor-like predicted transcriptional regulator